MLFSVGVELPVEQEQAFGLVVPALCNEHYACHSAADTEAQIKAMATEAITALIEEMLNDGVAVASIKDLGVMTYRKQEEYAYCDAWLLLEVDLSDFEGKPKRINVSLPDTLIQRIDNRVQASHGQYRDRSHFIAVSARHELEEMGA